MSPKTILVIPDLHCPFEHKDTWSFLQSVKKKYKPKEFICLGDEVDFHALGNWDHDPDGFSPGHELEKALESMHECYKIFPKMKVCTSNHTIRPLRKAFQAGIPRKFIRDYHEFLEAPEGWQWADHWLIDNIRFEHGEGTSGRNASYILASGNRCSTVHGHIHSFAGVVWSGSPTSLIFGFNVGCLIDNHAYAFAYGRKLKHKPVIGCGLIESGIPRFIPMLLTKSGRWTGNLP